MPVYTVIVHTVLTMKLYFSAESFFRISPQHQMSGDIFVCNDCGRAYTRKTNLMRHRRFECGKEPQFECKLCPYKAKQKSNLKIHYFCKHRI